MTDRIEIPEPMRQRLIERTADIQDAQAAMREDMLLARALAGVGEDWQILPDASAFVAPAESVEEGEA